MRGAERHALRACLLACVVGVATSARAEPAPDCSKARGAEAIFQCGKRLLDAGHLEAACEALARSERMEPSVGTLGLLATCHEKLGRTATARKLYEEVADRARAKKDDRERFARERARELASRAPQLVVEPYPGEWPTVIVGGRRLERSELGSAIEIDPGLVVVEASGSSGEREAQELRVLDGERRVVRLPSLEPKRPEPGEARSAGPPAHALVAAGVGAAGLVVMGVTGSLAIARNADSNDAEPLCVAGDRAICSEGREAREEATSFAHVATAGFVVGLSGLALGALFWALDGDEREAPAVQAGLAPTPGGGFATLRLRF